MPDNSRIQDDAPLASTNRLSQLYCDLRARCSHPFRTTISLSGRHRQLQDVLVVFAAHCPDTHTSRTERLLHHRVSYTGHVAAQSLGPCAWHPGPTRVNIMTDLRTRTSVTADADGNCTRKTEPDADNTPNRWRVARRSRVRIRVAQRSVVLNPVPSGDPGNKRRVRPLVRAIAFEMRLRDRPTPAHTSLQCICVSGSPSPSPSPSPLTPPSPSSCEPVEASRNAANCAHPPVEPLAATIARRARLSRSSTGPTSPLLVGRAGRLRRRLARAGATGGDESRE
ncbi:hypothetical protein B0H19DRAFT_1252384 [Mycena capillaripes]|nr:hypothetical protein B0H19DRAFT_1252384 [Mycena capillaripes]